MPSFKTIINTWSINLINPSIIGSPIWIKSIANTLLFFFMLNLFWTIKFLHYWLSNTLSSFVFFNIVILKLFLYLCKFISFQFRKSFQFFLWCRSSQFFSNFDFMYEFLSFYFFLFNILIFFQFFKYLFSFFLNFLL